MFEQLVGYLQQNGFCKAGGNSSNLLILCKGTEIGMQVISLYRVPNGNELSLDQFLEIEGQIQQKFGFEQGQTSIVSFLCTKNPGAVSRLLQYSSHTGVIDLEEGKLFVYEGMSEDFSEIYEGLEELCLNVKQERTRIYKKEVVKNIGIVNTLIVSINIVIFITLLITHSYESVVDAGALSWIRVIKDQEWYRIITSMFLHAGIEHLVYNMLTLFLIGNVLERIVGSLKYLFLYLGSGIISALISMGYHWYQRYQVSSIGASGAIFGVVGAVLYIVLVNKGKVETLGRRKMLLFVFLSLYGGFTSSGIDNVAHVGGLIGGLFLTALCYKPPKKVRV